jgi:hypothetical protein
MDKQVDPRRIAKNEALRREDNERLQAHNASIHWGRSALCGLDMRVRERKLQRACAAIGA